MTGGTFANYLFSTFLEICRAFCDVRHAQISCWFMTQNASLSTQRFNLRLMGVKVLQVSDKLNFVIVWNGSSSF